MAARPSMILSLLRIEEEKRVDGWSLLRRQNTMSLFFLLYLWNSKGCPSDNYGL